MMMYEEKSVEAGETFAPFKKKIAISVTLFFLSVVIYYGEILECNKNMDLFVCWKNI